MGKTSFVYFSIPNRQYSIFYFWRRGRRAVSYHFPFNLHTSSDLAFLKKAGSLDLDSGAPRASPLELGCRAPQIPCPFTQLKSQFQEKKPGRLDLILGLGLLSGWGTETKGQLSILSLLIVNSFCSPSRLCSFGISRSTGAALLPGALSLAPREAGDSQAHCCGPGCGVGRKNWTENVNTSLTLHLPLPLAVAFFSWKRWRPSRAHWRKGAAAAKFGGVGVELC